MRACCRHISVSAWEHKNSIAKSLRFSVTNRHKRPRRNQTPVGRFLSSRNRKRIAISSEFLLQAKMQGFPDGGGHFGGPKNRCDFFTSVRESQSQLQKKYLQGQTLIHAHLPTPANTLLRVRGVLKGAGYKIPDACRGGAQNIDPHPHPWKIPCGQKWAGVLQFLPGKSRHLVHSGEYLAAELPKLVSGRGWV